MNQDEQEQLVGTYWDIWERCQSDPEYALLRKEMEKVEPLYREALGGLPADCQARIDAYIRCRETMSRRMLEFACAELIEAQTPRILRWLRNFACRCNKR